MRGPLLPILLLVNAALAAAAEPGADLAEGKRLYQSADFVRAVNRLHLAAQALEPERELERGRIQLVDAYMHLGLAYCAIGDPEQAKAAFRRVLALDPKRRLDGETYAPKVVELFEQARSAAPRVVDTFPPLPTRERRVSVDWTTSEVTYDGRERPYPAASSFRDAAGPLHEIAGGSYRPSASTRVLRARVRLSPTLGSLRATVRSGTASTGSVSLSTLGSTTFVGTERITTDREEGEIAAEELVVREYELRWIKELRGGHGPRVDLEVSYRHLRADESVQERVYEEIDGVIRSSTTLGVDARLRAHGMRLGLGASTPGARTLFGTQVHFDAAMGVTALVVPTDDGSVRLESFEFPTAPLERSTAFKHYTTLDLGADLLAQMRVELGRTVYLRLGFAGERLTRRVGRHDATLTSSGVFTGVVFHIGR